MNYIILNEASNKATRQFDRYHDLIEDYMCLFSKNNKIGFCCENVRLYIEKINIENWKANDIEYVCNEMKNEMKTNKEIEFATAGVIVKGDTTEQICERLSIINNYIYDNSVYTVSEKLCIS